MISGARAAPARSTSETATDRKPVHDQPWRCVLRAGAARAPLVNTFHLKNPGTCWILNTIC